MANIRSSHILWTKIQHWRKRLLKGWDPDFVGGHSCGSSDSRKVAVVLCCADESFWKEPTLWNLLKEKTVLQEGDQRHFNTKPRREEEVPGRAADHRVLPTNTLFRSWWRRRHPHAYCRSLSSKLTGTSKKTLFCCNISPGRKNIHRAGKKS